MISLPESFTPLLAVDDDKGLLLSVKASLLSAGLPEPALVSDSRKVMDVIRQHPFQVVLLDLIMPHIGGIELLEEIKNEAPQMECIIITAVDDVNTAVQAMKFGAYDYLVKPLQTEKLLIVVKNALEKYELRRKIDLFETSPSFSTLKHAEAFEGIVAKDVEMARVFHQAETYGENDYNLLITGETGVGKEMLARAVHRLSLRSAGPFVAISMPSLSRTLFEDEVFGHAKGAYTGADSEKKGFFEEAQGGTLFLDEIAEMSPEMQAKLLRVVQEKELYRIGSTKARPVDVRIIAATNRDIHEQMRTGGFRRDLFYRLSVCHIHIPSLSRRREDILPLAHHFLKFHCRKTGKKIRSISPEACRALLDYPFPGNVRELENIIASSVLVEKEDVLTLGSVGNLIQCDRPAAVGGDALVPLKELEKSHILRVLEHTGNNRTRAASVLGISLRTLQRKIKEYEKASS